MGRPLEAEVAARGATDAVTTLAGALPGAVEAAAAATTGSDGPAWVFGLNTANDTTVAPAATTTMNATKARRPRRDLGIG